VPDRPGFCALHERRVRQCDLGEASDREVRRCGAIDDRRNDARRQEAARFSLRALEGIAVGLARNKDAIVGNENPDEFVRERVSEFWKRPGVREMSAPGLSGLGVLLQRQA
jgi:hypothetical protein